MAFSDSFLQEISYKNNIEDIASNYTNLKRGGRTSVGLCPFHGEKTPSFHVYNETNSFYCFGCGAGGDVITFIKLSENLGYVDAIRYLADRAGIKVPEDSYDDTASKLRLRILEANRGAARFFHRVLYNTPEGKNVLKYYENRGFNEGLIKKFGLGYAMDSFNTLRDFMKQKGFDESELLAANLIARSRRNTNNTYDIFRNRIIIPIIDVRGNVIGFGGRVLDDSKPKYINTSDTLVYKKTNNLFALNFAKATKKDYLILCEGYMDVIALFEAGFDNAVAALGTSFTKDHAQLIARYSSEVVILFDSDDAGRKGAKRAISFLRTHGVRIRVVNVPEGMDPDDYLQKYGTDRLKLLIERSANDVEYQLIELGGQYDLTSSEGQVAYLREASNFLSRLSSPVERDIYAGRLAKDLSVGKEAILAQIENSLRYRRRRERKNQLSKAVAKSDGKTETVNPEAKKFVRAASAEEGMLGMLMLHNDYIKTAKKNISPNEMVTDFNKKLFEKILLRFNQGIPIELTFFAADYSNDDMAYISKMLQQAKSGEQNVDVLIDYIKVIKAEHAMLKFNNPSELSEDKLKEMLDVMREQKK